MITKGSTSAYTTWVHMENEPGEYVISYKNVGKRFIKLAKYGLLEEIKLNLENLHGRKDYRVSMKGMEQLIPYILTHAEEVKNIVHYMDKFKIDKAVFADALLKILLEVAKTISEYQKATNTPYHRRELAEVVNQLYDNIVESGSQLVDERFNKDYKEILEMTDKDKKSKKKQT